MPVPPAAVHTTAVAIAAVAAAVTAAAAAHEPWSQLRGYTQRGAQNAVQPTKLFIAVYPIIILVYCTTYLCRHMCN